MAVTTTPLGFKKPDGGDPVRNGDNVIADNAQKVEDRIQEDRGRLGAIEAVNVTQDGRLTSTEAKDVAQDGRLNLVEAKNAAQDVAFGAAVKKSDPGIPTPTEGLTTEGDSRTFIAQTVDSTGRMNTGTLADGTVFFERTEHEQLKQGDFTATVVPGTLNIISGHIDSAGNAADDCIGPDGRFLPETVASLKRRIGIVDVPNPATLPLDIIIIAGQSNSTQEDVLPAAVDPLPIDPRILVWNNSTSVIEPFYNTDARVHSFGPSFAREYLKTIPAGRAVLLIFNGAGSSGFITTSITPAPAGYETSGGGTWDRNLVADPVNYYARTIARATTAMTKAASGSKIVSWLWSQGESESGKWTQTQYAAAFDDMIGAARTALTAPKMHVVVGSMVPEWAATYAGANLIEYALEDTPRRLERSAYAPGPADLTDYTNPIHWSSQGQEARGPLLMTGFSRARYNVTGTEPVAPQRTRARRTGTTVLVEWEHPPSRFTGTELQYRVDGGTWTAATVTRPAATTAEITGIAPTSAIGIRLRTVNATGNSAYTKEVRA